MRVWPLAGGRVAVAKRLGLALFHPPAAVVMAAVVRQRLGPRAQ
ncbi:MAG TPA: hypothetical protein VGS14_10070 [Actinomycetes bacterium]|nr:hypothetical protein [Actinomycetes bacterium]